MGRGIGSYMASSVIRSLDARISHNSVRLSLELGRAMKPHSINIIRINGDGKMFVNSAKLGQKYCARMISNSFQPVKKDHRNVYIFCYPNASSFKIARFIRGLATGNLKLVENGRGLVRVITQDYSLTHMLAQAEVDYVKASPNTTLSEQAIRVLDGALLRNPSLDSSLKCLHKTQRNQIIDGIVNDLLHGTLDFWGNLTDKEKNVIAGQISRLDMPLIRTLLDQHGEFISSLGEIVRSNVARYEGRVGKPDLQDMTWIENADALKKKEWKEAGEAYLKERANKEKEAPIGRLSMLVLAAGAATRFGLDSPKAVYQLFGESTQVKPPKGVSEEFSFIASAIMDALNFEKNYGVALPIVITTSPGKRGIIEEHLIRNNFFGANRENITLIYQTGEMPRIYRNLSLALKRDNQGNALPEIDMAPTGHGWALDAVQNHMPPTTEVVFVRNVDNLAATVSDETYATILGALLEAKKEKGRLLAIELAERRKGDKGGSPVSIDGRNTLLEGEDYIKPVAPEVWDHLIEDAIPFNTLTMTIFMEAIRETVKDEGTGKDKYVKKVDRVKDLPWYMVKKSRSVLNDQWPLFQFEQMLGSLSEIVPAEFIVAAKREERFIPNKELWEVPEAVRTFVEQSKKKGISLIQENKEKA